MNLKPYADYYKQYLKKDIIITAGKKGKVYTFKLVFLEDHFYHLLGFQKLIDLDISRLKRKNIFYRDVYSGRRADIAIEESRYFNEVKNRLSSFFFINELLGQEIIIRFDRRKAYTSINAHLLFFMKYQIDYIHLFFKENNGLYHPCSLFRDSSTKYTANQEVCKILDLKIIPLKA